MPSEPVEKKLPDDYVEDAADVDERVLAKRRAEGKTISLWSNCLIFTFTVKRRIGDVYLTSEVKGITNQ